MEGLSTLEMQCEILRVKGIDDRVDKLAEEQAELQHALRNKDRAAIVDELTDNLVLFDQIIEEYGIEQHEIAKIYEFKVIRTYKDHVLGGNAE